MSISPEFKLSILTTAREIGEDFTDPDDDWMPTLLLSNDEQIKIVGLPFADEIEKKIMFELLVPQMISKFKINGFGFISSTWVSKYPKEEMSAEDQALMSEGKRPSGMPEPRHDPNRGEALMVCLVTKEQQESWSAEITRDGVNPPELGEWVISEQSSMFLLEPAIKALV